jgi:hypothetical protein
MRTRGQDSKRLRACSEGGSSQVTTRHWDLGSGIWDLVGERARLRRGTPARSISRDGAFFSCLLVLRLGERGGA